MLSIDRIIWLASDVVVELILELDFQVPRRRNCSFRYGDYTNTTSRGQSLRRPEGRERR